MEFVNHTPFPALAFAGIDQHDQEFHVAVLRQTLTWNADGVLDYADEQLPLCEVDTFSGEMNASSVLQESDLCQYKPKCDVIVNGTAYAPAGKPVKRFQVRLTVRRPDTPMPIPEPPQGLNPLMTPSLEAQTAWRAAVEQAKGRIVPGQTLIDKALTICGERSFMRPVWPLYGAGRLIKLATFGLINPLAWRLTEPKPVLKLPVQAEYAFGGQCRVNATDRAASQVPKKHQLTLEQISQHPDRDLPVEQQPIAHSAFEPNPIGRGYTLRWYIDATGATHVSAPQIEHPDKPITVQDFIDCMESRLDKDRMAGLATGFGIRPKGHPERALLNGTIDEAFVKSEAWLPEDFDFAVWNAAPPDQQTDFLAGDEIIELLNLSAPGAPGTRQHANGDTVLTLRLPAHGCHLLVRLWTGEMFMHPMSIDTVIVEPDAQRLTLVYRTVLAKDDDVVVRAIEARMQTLQEREQWRRKIDELKAQLAGPDQDANLIEAGNAQEVSHG